MEIYSTNYVEWRTIRNRIKQTAGFKKNIYFACLLLSSFCITPLFSQYVINGTTVPLGGDCFQLTTTAPSQAGSVFSANTINLNEPFNVSVIANFGCSDSGADGIVFLFSTSNTALGIGGGGIGYEGIIPSFAVEFDTWQNGDRGDIVQDHAAIISNGSNFHNSPNNLSGPENLGNIEDCAEHCAEFDWDPATQTFTVIYDDQPILSYTGDIAANFFSGNSNVYWGFTGSTGGASNVQTVCLGPPELDPMPDVTICEGASTVLQADANGINWEWAPDPTLSAFDISNPTASPTITTTYDVTISYNCNYTLTDEVTVFVTPPPSVNASNDSPVCEGETVSLFAEGGVSYSWSGPTAFTSGLQNPVILDVTASNAGTYSVTVTDEAGCTAVTTTEVIINAPPPVVIIPPGDLCADEALVVLTATPTGGTWGGIADASGNIFPLVIGPGFFPVTYSYTDANGCTTTEQIDILIFPNPDVTIVPIDPLCESDGVQTLFADPPGGEWGGDASPGGTFDPASGPGLYTITYDYTDFNNCGGNSSIEILVLPATPIFIDPPGPFCESDSSYFVPVQPTGGMWSGQIGPGGEINPGLFGPGLFSATYTYNVPGECPSSELITYEIIADPQVIISSPAPPCETDDPFFLSAAPPGGSWSGAANAQGEVDPGNLGPGTYTVGYTYNSPAGCGDYAEIEITINPSPVVGITPVGPFCTDAPIQTLTASPTGGQWGGVASNTGQINPALLGEGIFEVTYNYTSPEGCTVEASTLITINPLPEINLPQVGPFCRDEGIQTLTADPAGGQWGGIADSLGQFNPANYNAGNYIVSYSYTDANGCTNTAQIPVQINNVPTVQITPAGPFCADAQTQQLFAIPSGGTWSGIAEANGQIDIANFGAGLYEAIYSFTTPAGCMNVDTQEILIHPIPAAILSGTDTICTGNGNEASLIFNLQGTGQITVLYTIDGVQEPPISFDSSGLYSIPTTAPGLYLISEVSDELGCVQTGLGNAVITVADAPMAVNPEITCSADNQFFTFFFEIIGGDTSSYEVIGNEGAIFSGTPYYFESNPITSGTAYNFQLTDAFACDTIILAGVFSCDCTTETGIMQAGLTSVCAMDTAVVSYDSTSQVTDGNDILLFALHTQNGQILGNVLAWNDEPVFPFNPANMSYGTTYYISAVLGNDDGTGKIDLNDPCLSVAPGSPVIFRPIPTASVSGDGSICLEGTRNLLFNFTGNGPFQLTFSDGIDTFSLSGITNGTSYPVSPSETKTYTILSVGDNSQPTCYGIGGDIATITVNFPIETQFTETICSGDSILLGGDFQKEPGIYIDSLLTNKGCDSIKITELFLFVLDTTYLSTTSCDPAQTGTSLQFFTNQDGCDSLVITETTFVSADTTLLFSNTCQQNQSGTFTTIYANQLNCDSFVVETITFIPPDTTFLTYGDCNPNQTGVFSTVLSNQFGCDSLIITDVFLLESDTTYLFSSTCDPDQAGIFQNLLSNQDGCDSLIVLSVDLLPTDTNYLFNTTCDPGQAGIFQNLLNNQYGCDSLVINTIDLLPSDTILLFNTTCDPNQAGVFQELLTNQYGCDSLVIHTIDLLPTDTTYLFNTTCNPNQAGIFQTLLTNQYGCDSLLVNTIDLLPSDTTLLFKTTCDPNQAGVFTQILANQYGCDSLVINTIDLLPSDTTILYFESCFPADTGTSIIILGNQWGCDSVIYEITTLPPPDECTLQVLLTGSDLPCGVLTGSLFFDITNGLPPYDYSWTGTAPPFSGAGVFISGINQQLDGFSPGIYTFEFISSDGLKTTIQGTVTENFPPLITVQTSAVYNGYDLSCADSQDGVAAVSIISGGSPPFQYQWSDGSNTTVADNLSAGWVAVTVTDQKNCSSADSILLIAPSPLQTNIITRDLDCSGVANGGAIVEVIGGVLPYQYLLDGQDLQPDPSFSGLSAGNYAIEVIDDNDCQFFTSFTLDAPEPLLVELGDDKFIKVGDSVILEAQTNFPYPSLDTIIWYQIDSSTCGNCPAITVSPPYTHIYEIYVLAQNGCEASDRITVFVDRERQIYIPSAFSPNGDGVNDRFTIFGDNTAKDINSLQIFDRWGNRVFEGKNLLPGDVNAGWDGMHQGKKLAPAVFVYFAEVEFFDGHVEFYRGSVTLVR